MLGKLFQQGTIAKHCVRKIKSVVDEILRRNLLLSDKIAERHFCDYEDDLLRVVVKVVLNAKIIDPKYL